MNTQFTRQNVPFEGHFAKNKPVIIFLYGPTGVGKTAFSDHLARHLPIEIVNMDVGQFYSPFSIGTAKPAWQHSPTRHHLFDILNEPRSLTVTQYRNMIIQTIDEIRSRGNIPVVVGGSGFYLYSLLFPPLLNQEINTSEKIEGDWKDLYAIDPKRAAAINPTDTYRIQRALLIWHKTGKLPSEQNPVFNPPAHFILLYLTRNRQELYARINERVHSMMDEGWMAEVTSLKSTNWEPFLQDKKLIGYSEILEYISHNSDELSFDQLVQLISQKTRNYAKRQDTFWRMLQKRLYLERKSEHAVQFVMDPINLTLLDLDLYINQLSEKLVTLLKES